MQCKYLYHFNSKLAPTVVMIKSTAGHFEKLVSVVYCLEKYFDGNIYTVENVKAGQHTHTIYKLCKH